MKRYLKIGSLALLILALGLFIGNGTIGELLRFGDEGIGAAADSAEVAQVEAEGALRGSQSADSIYSGEDNASVSPAELERKRLGSKFNRARRDVGRAQTVDGERCATEDERYSVNLAITRVQGGAILQNDILLDATFIDDYLDALEDGFLRETRGLPSGCRNLTNLIFFSRNPNDDYDSYAEYVLSKEWEVR